MSARLRAYARLSLPVAMVTGLSACPIDTHAQPPSAPSVGAALTTLRAGLTRVQAKYRTSDEATFAVARDAAAAATRLIQAWQQGGSPELTADYARAIQFEAYLVDTAYHVDRADSARALLREIRDDLQVKERYGAAGLAASSGFRGSVQVVVTTQRAGAPVNGILIRTSPRRWADPAHPLYAFNAASSPTSRTLPPGNYVIFAFGADNKLIAQQAASIGVGDSVTDSVTVVLP